jgi:hypothetical protein
LDPRLSKTITTQAAVGAGLSLAHSLWTRGFRRTLLFGLLGHTVPVLGEYLAVNVVKVLRHHVKPQGKVVPWAVSLGWYNVGYGTFAMSYGTFAMIESILSETQLDEAERRRSLYEVIYFCVCEPSIWYKGLEREGDDAYGPARPNVPA